MFMKSDSDVTLFAKTLKNECDQEFRQVQEYVKEQVQVALKMTIKEKFPLKSESDIHSLFDVIRNGGTTMEKWMWSKTLRKLYN